MRKEFLGVLHGLCVFALLVLFAYSSERLAQLPRQRVLVEMEVALPVWVQVLMAGGDRYLAANLGGFRALVASTDRMSGENFRIQGLVQRDVAFLNPSHEDNYYIAAAILPWNGEVESAQSVLRNAIDGRPRDPLPPFFYGFGRYYFFGEPVEGADWVRIAASRAANDNDRLSLEALAATWYQKGNDAQVALGIIRSMAETARPEAFRRHLFKRVRRLEILIELRDAASMYQKKFGKMPGSLNDLVAKGILNEIPQDPTGLGFSVSPEGLPVLIGRGIK